MLMEQTKRSVCRVRSYPSDKADRAVVVAWSGVVGEKLYRPLIGVCTDLKEGILQTTPATTQACSHTDLGRLKTAPGTTPQEHWRIPDLRHSVSHSDQVP